MKLKLKNTLTYNSNLKFKNKKNNLALEEKELHNIEQIIDNNKEQIKRFILQTDILKIKKKEYEDKQSIKEKISELEISLNLQKECKQSLQEQKKLLKAQMTLRVEFKKFRVKIHELNIEIKEISNLQHDLDTLKKQIKVIEQSIAEIEKHEKEYMCEIEKFYSLMNQHKNEIIHLKKLELKLNNTLESEQILNTYESVLNTMNIELNDIYKTKIDALNSKLKHQQEKKKNASIYRKKLEKNRNILNSNLTNLEIKVNKLNELKIKLLDIVKIGRKNNEELSKIKNTDYDIILFNNLLEQYNGMRKEYESVLGLEESIKKIPILKKEIEFLRDENIKLTQKKITITHQVGKTICIQN